MFCSEIYSWCFPGAFTSSTFHKHLTQEKCKTEHHVVYCDIFHTKVIKNIDWFETFALFAKHFLLNHRVTVIVSNIGNHCVSGFSNIQLKKAPFKFFVFTLLKTRNWYAMPFWHNQFCFYLLCGHFSNIFMVEETNVSVATIFSSNASPTKLFVGLNKNKNCFYVNF